ncbi:hypothetical protein QTG56_21405 [Rossellomorea sp. AcN35-11]|nr:hypothetical protein [Rossellomorea aquimaris]NMH69229.1 hypothetical protein [Bacillus sp. RO3]WJV29450.1 hypothetical protein QTG56_21405 [Rossellomorea sp. AcN35-11]
MEGKPFHYDGSHPSLTGEGQENTPFELTDEVRKKIVGNPFEASGEEE